MKWLRFAIELYQLMGAMHSRAYAVGLAVAGAATNALLLALAWHTPWLRHTLTVLFFIGLVPWLFMVVNMYIGASRNQRSSS